MKKIKFLAMLLMVSLLLVACGPKTDTKPEETKTAESTETTDTLIQKKKQKKKQMIKMLIAATMQH